MPTGDDSPPTLDLGQVETFIDGVGRPEGICVSGSEIWCGDSTGLVGFRSAEPGATLTRSGSGGTAPNGLALDHRGRLLVADYGDGAGLHRFDPRTGATDRLSVTSDGHRLRRANHPAVDRAGRVWVTDSTAGDDDVAAVLKGHRDGTLLVVDPDGRGPGGPDPDRSWGRSRVVVDGLRFPNGLAFDRAGRKLFVAESGARSLVRVPVEGSSVGRPEPFGPADLGGVPDGVAVDSNGWVWVTLVFDRRAVVAVAPDGSRVITVLEDHDGNVLGNPTNLAFGLTTADGSVGRRPVADRSADAEDGGNPVVDDSHPAAGAGAWLYLADPEHDRVLRVPCPVAGRALPPE